MGGRAGGSVDGDTAVAGMDGDGTVVDVDGDNTVADADGVDANDVGAVMDDARIRTVKVRARTETASTASKQSHQRLIRVTDTLPQSAQRPILALQGYVR